MTTETLPEFIAAYRYPYAIPEWEAMVDEFTAEVGGSRIEQPTGGSSVAARIDLGNGEQLHVALLAWRGIINQLGDLSYVLLIRHTPGTLANAQYFYISLSHLELYPNEVKLSSVHKQLLRFWEDSKLPPEERRWKPPVDGASNGQNFGAFGGGLQQVPSHYEKGDWLDNDSAS